MEGCTSGTRLVVNPLLAWGYNMAITDWRLFIQERLRAYQPDISLGQGTPATVQVVDPIVNRLAPDPIETKLLTFIMTRLQQEHPMLYAREGSTIMDLLVKPNLVLLEPLRREITSVKNQLTLLYPEQLNSDEADALVANFFITRKLGDYARVKVRLYFQNPVSVNIGTSNVAFTARGLRFLPTRAQSITAEGMLTNWDGNLYYFDVNYVSERAGSAYNIAASEIIGVTGIASATRATNLTKANPGSDEETTSQLVSRAERSLGERSLTTVPGIVFNLFDQFPELTILQIIGYNDPEMMRDVITGGNLGDVVTFGDTGATSDDGDADGYTWFFSDLGASFTTVFGPVGTDISSYTLTAWYLDGGVLTPHDFKLSEVVGATEISIDPELDGSDRLPDSLSNVVWSIRKRALLTLSNIPGGIIFPSLMGGEVEIQDGVIHVGGCTDFYVRGGAIEDKSLAVELVADQDVLVRQEDARTTVSSSVVVLNDVTLTEFNTIVAGKSCLYLEEGSDQGPYRIIEKVVGGPPYSVRLQQEMTATATDISFVIVDDVDVDLLNPKDIRFEGSDLRTVAGSPIIDTVSGTPDFVGVGVTDDDVVEILSGDDEGQYTIVTGGVAAGQIVLSANMSVTGSPLQYRIFHMQDGIDLPLLRVKSVERLDSGLEPTGELIPFRHPVDIQSRSFQNPGREGKVGTLIDVTEGSYLRATSGSKIVSAVSLAGAPMGIDFWTLGVRPGDLVNINSTDNQGYYTAEAVGVPGGLSADQIQVTEAMRWTTSSGQDMRYEIGGPSFGSFRLYFLDPVTFETSYSDTVFSVSINGVNRRFRPDPEIFNEFLPTDVTIPTVDMTAASGDVTPYTVGGATTIDLLAHQVAVGDRVEISYAPIIGSKDLTAGSINLDGKRLKVDVGYGIETIYFSGTSLGADEIIAQMNAQLTREVAAKYTAPAATIHAMLRADIPISLVSDGAAEDATALVFGTSRVTFHPWLAGSFVNVTTENDSPDKGLYLVQAISSYPPGSVTLTEMDGSAWTAAYTIHETRGPYIRVSRSGVQRISSTAMLEQIDELGFYYFDVECISEGFGTPWNISADLQASAEGYESEGWEISVEDENLSYSMAEHPWIHISPRILVAGNEDDETNKIELVGGNVQVVYERDPLVQDVHTFVTDAQTRVVCQSPLARSLFPKFVRTSITYRGGGEVRDVRSALAAHIEAVLPEQMLEVSDMAKIIADTGSSYVQLPINLVGIGYNADRSILVERGQDTISSGRLSALLPDDNEETADGASYISLTRII